jgi:hypothetical protein
MNLPPPTLYNLQIYFNPMTDSNVRNENPLAMETVECCAFGTG